MEPQHSLRRGQGLQSRPCLGSNPPSSTSERPNPGRETAPRLLSKWGESPSSPREGSGVNERKCVRSTQVPPTPAVAPRLYSAEEASGERTNRTRYQVGLEKGGGAALVLSRVPEEGGQERGLGAGGRGLLSQVLVWPELPRARGASHSFPMYIHLRLCSGSKRALFRERLPQSRRRYILK